MQGIANDHYVQLSSKTKSVFNDKNKCNNFKVKLQSPLDLRSGYWKAALTKIIYPHTWLNVKQDDASLWIIHHRFNVPQFPYGTPQSIPNDVYFCVRDYLNKRLGYDLLMVHWNFSPISLHSGSYENAGEIAANILQSFSLVRDRKDYDSLRLTYNYEPTTRRIEFFHPSALVFYKADKFVQALGLLNPKIKSGSAVLFSEDRDLTATGKGNIQNLNAIYAYSSAVEYNNVGDRSVPLLTVIPVKGKRDSSITYAPHKLEYKPVSQNYINDIEVQLNNNTGGLIDFEDGDEVSLTLHFKKEVSIN